MLLHFVVVPFEFVSNTPVLHTRILVVGLLSPTAGTQGGKPREEAGFTTLWILCSARFDVTDERVRSVHSACLNAEMVHQGHKGTSIQVSPHAVSRLTGVYEEFSDVLPITSANTKDIINVMHHSRRARL